VEKNQRLLRKSWRTAAPGGLLQGRAPAPHHIGHEETFGVGESMFAEFSPSLPKG
jgi:hypothetical protein